MKQRILQIIIWVWFYAAVYGDPFEASTSQLILAPIIEVGHVDSYSGTKTRNTNGLVLNIAQISVNEPIKGLSGKKHDLNLWCDERSGYGEFGGVKQAPPPGYQCVLFLSHDKKTFEYAPVSQEEFAIQLERDPSEKAGSTLDRLRAIAIANVEATNYGLAVRWARFLRDLHDDAHNDFSYWTNKTQDARILIRATAYEALLNNFPLTPGLRAEVIKCLSEANPTNVDQDVWSADQQMITSLSKLFHNEPPKAEEIQSLLDSGDEEVNKMALSLIRSKKDLSMAANVVHLMTGTKNREVQYNCIKTLYVLADNPFVIGYPHFLEHPDDYIKEWKRIGEGLAN